ncbi:hypothetical protein E3J79_00645 [Candidatus Dependentiae bacterium]|nr:MAG: hypothetical protein E3J79_00645 [Candidatus Dependentiae bacterium]
MARLFTKCNPEIPASSPGNIIFCTLAALIPMGAGFLISYFGIPERKYISIQKYIETLQKSEDWKKIFAVFEDKDTFLRKIKNYYKSELVPIISAYDFINSAYRKLKKHKKDLADILKKKGNYIHWVSELELLISTIDELIHRIKEVEAFIEQEPNFDKWLIIKRLSDEIKSLRQSLKRSCMHQQKLPINPILHHQPMMNINQMLHQPMHINTMRTF